MCDILERLRDHEDDPELCYYGGDLISEAADEIEELRAELFGLTSKDCYAPDKT
jgi:hypothetical protein